eukprot:359987-Chlamydomonas_euryale.AAC.1
MLDTSPAASLFAGATMTRRTSSGAQCCRKPPRSMSCAQSPWTCTVENLVLLWGRGYARLVICSRPDWWDTNPTCGVLPRGMRHLGICAARTSAPAATPCLQGVPTRASLAGVRGGRGGSHTQDGSTPPFTADVSASPKGLRPMHQIVAAEP